MRESNDKMYFYFKILLKILNNQIEKAQHSFTLFLKSLF